MVRPKVSRVLFGVATGIFAVSFLQETSFIYRDGYLLNWAFYLGLLTTFIGLVALTLPVFLAGKRVIAVISVLAVYLAEFLFRIIILIRDLEYIFDSDLREIIQYWILPFFMIPSYAPGLSIESLLFDTSAYLRLIGFIVAIVAAVLTFGGSRIANEQATPFNSRSAGAPVFMSARDIAAHSSTSTSLDGFDQVERLGDLLKKGLITQEEFDLKKRQILGL
jgi:hypothetical protein